MEEMGIIELLRRAFVATENGKAAEVMFEVRLRTIIREELELYEKRQQQTRRYGLPIRAEVK